MTVNTVDINSRMDRFDRHRTVWLFGYGSIIFKVDFPYLTRRAASIRHWARRFWQGSHDHRGTPESPGRVVTLVPERNAVCTGAAYLVTPSVFHQLDVREKNGYLRKPVDLAFDNGERAEGLVYIATDDNAAYLGPAAEQRIARQIATSSGPSGHNRDYLLQLADALRELGDNDPHVFSIERHLRELDDR